MNIKISKQLMQGSPYSAGYDLEATENVELEKGKVSLVPTGIFWDPEDLVENMHICAKIYNRSGMAKKGIIVSSSVGIIDADYRGEWFVPMTLGDWHKGYNYTVRAGDRIAQVIFEPSLHPNQVIIDTFSVSSRGAGGFGSTGE